ncbi:endonuclease/exonuclease/phosphatase family protein [Cooperia oncophora]
MLFILSVQLLIMIKCMLSNVRSFVKNSDAVISLLIRESYDLVFLSESWLTPNIEVSSLLGVANSQYTHLRCDRARRKGGGVLILIRNAIPHNIVFSESVPEAYEIIVIDAYLNLTTVRFVLIYRTPSCNALKTNLLLKAISDFSSHDGATLVLGDFNMADASVYQSDAGNSVSKEFVQTLYSHEFVQLVHTPTRGSSILDLVFCNRRFLVSGVNVLPPIGTRFLLNIYKPDPQVALVRDFSRVDWRAVGDYLGGVDWIGSFGSVCSVNDKYELFLSILNDVINTFVPLCNVKRGYRSLPGYLDRMITRCADLWDLAVKENTETCWTSYKQFTRKLDKALAKYYASVENKIIASKVPSKLYNYINSRLKARNKLPALVVDESHLAISDKDKAELLAEKFQLAFFKPLRTIHGRPHATLSCHGTNSLVSSGGDI